MIEEGYDLVIRVNPAPDESLVGRAFLHDRLVVVAPPDIVLLSLDQPVPGVVRGGAGPETWNVMTTKGAKIRLSSLIMVRDAVRGRRRAARLPISLVSHDVAAGTLMHWGEVENSEIALWAYTRRGVS